MSSDSIWKEKIVQWLESCHTGDFVDESKEEVLERVAAESKAADYVDPTQSLPVVPPPKCSQHQVPLSDCKPCTQSKGWWEAFKHTVNDLLSKSNIHDCNRNINKDGTRRKNRASGACTNNRWGKCKARFPRLLFLSTKIDPDTGAIDMKKTEPWINTFSPVVTFIFRCNTDITSLSSGTAIKSMVLYISDYITKTSLKTHTIFESIRSVFHKNSEMIGGTLPAKEKARQVMTKVVNLLTAKMEMGVPMICMYLLGNPDHYTDHKFVTFYWQSYVSEARRAFTEVGIAEGHKIAIIKKNGQLIGLSPVFDYIYRSPELENVNLYDWITQFKKVKLPKPSSKRDKEGKDLVILTTDDAEDFSPDISFASFASKNSEIRPEADVKSTPVKLSKNMFRFTNEHPLHATHALQRLPVDHKRIPNFVGANLPRCDQGNREYYCSTMLVLFKAWRTGNDLRLKDLSWDESFSEYNFSERDVRIMKNSNIRYECLDAHDDYRAQLKKGSTGLANIFGSWDEANDDVELDECQPTAHMEQEYEDVPLENIGCYQCSRLLNMQTMSAVLSNTGWSQEKVTQITVPPFKPSIIQSGSEWQATVLNRRQQVLDQRNENNTSSKHPNISGKGPAAENIVKIVDKSYLERTFTAKEGQCNVDDTVKRFKLNKEQERAFKIVVNHASSKYSEQLKMYIGGMGGTGKSQVLKALSHFFALQNESHRFVIVAPMGTAAALLGGSTYHYMFGINEYSGASNLSQIRSRLAGVDYVFLDEVSMLSARDMYRISAQLAKVFGVPDIPFGGMNMVFSGNFAQLPPAMGGENVSLYGRFIGSLSTDIKSQEELIGKALWHQISTIVILRENMRQRTQTPNDAKLRTVLENMRYKSCTPDDILFLKSRISSSVPNRPSVCDDNFRNISIITARNLHKDEINHVGAMRFANETGQSLTEFYSDDTTKVSRKSAATAAKATGTKHRLITPEIQDALWSQPPSTTDKQIAGKLSLCIGMPVMIRTNFAMELCLTRGQEGFVRGWQSSVGGSNQRILDTLFVELKNPPREINIDGLEPNVVPITRTVNAVTAILPDDSTIAIQRGQVEILINFAMTDFASQGKTRPYNVVDLNNLTTHQAYYTALSRSASADGTIILQGFDSSKITGRASGALRQEFRELEILDDMTRLHYEGKLKLPLTGNT